MSKSPNGLILQIQNCRRFQQLYFRKQTSVLGSHNVNCFSQSVSNNSNSPNGNPSADQVLESLEMPWRDSASLILSAPLPPHPGDPDSGLPNILITKRSKGSTFAPNTLCFPGGQLDPADSDPSWINLFGMMSGSNVRDIKFLSDTAQCPHIYGRKERKADADRKKLLDLYQNNKIPKHLSLRITAIRETFEECGILLCRRIDKKQFGTVLGRSGPLGVNGLGKMTNYVVINEPDELEEWQLKVKKDPKEFLKLCTKFSCFPDVDALVEWSNWLTPNSFGNKRFDTLFYLAIAPIPIPYLIDPYEVATARWTTAQEVLVGACNGKAKLIPPQIYELTRLRNTKLERLKQLMKMRLQLGIERICPCYIKAKDGILSLFPGDDLYPADYDIQVFEEIRQLDSTLDELRTSSSSHHRIEFKTEYDFKLIVNVGPKHGQIYVD